LGASGKELKFIQERAKGFLEVVDRKEQKRVVSERPTQQQSTVYVL
jgi:hypothetical protein